MKKSLVFLSLASMLFSVSMASCVNKTPKKDVGIQLYSLRKEIPKVGIDSVLKSVAEMGYTTTEGAGYNGKLYDLSAAELKALLDKYGLKMVSTHAKSPSPATTDKAVLDKWWDDCIAYHKALGCKYIVMPAMDKDARTDVNVLKQYCDMFNEVGAKCAAQGIKFGYHNHSFEFENKFDGVSMYDFMLQNTDPDKVFFQMDVYWVVRGGENPVNLVNKYPGRFKGYHVKDEALVGASGMVDFKSIFGASDKAGVEYLIVEVEKEEPGMDIYQTVSKSLDYLNNADFVKASYAK